MGNRFSGSSKKRLDTVDVTLQQVMIRALDFSIVDFGIPAYGGKRTAEEQNELFCNKASKCDGIDKVSKHQSGKAVDVIAYVNGKYTYDKEYYYMIYAAVMYAASSLGVRIRWGGDWDGDLDLKDQTFNDLCHFEMLD